MAKGRPKKIIEKDKHPRITLRYIALAFLGVGIVLFIVALYVAHQKTITTPLKGISPNAANTSIAPSPQTQAHMNPQISVTPSALLNTTLGSLKGLSNTSSK